MPDTPEHVIYGDRDLLVTMDAKRVYWSEYDHHDGETVCIQQVSRAQMDEIVRGYQREKEQEAARDRDR